MKKYIGLFFIIYIFFQINSLSYSQDDRWVYITESDKVSYYLDKLTIECDEYGNIEVWTKRYCLSDCREQVGYKIINYTIAKTIYYLRERKTKTLKVIDYYTDESNFMFDNTGRASERDVVPDSVGETIYDYITSHCPCK